MKNRILKFVLVFQGFYYAITGLWAIVSLESFSRITRHFGDPFEMHSISAMSFIIGLFFLWSSRKEELLRSAGYLALGFVLAVMIPELIYLPQIGNPTLFWADFALEGIIGILLLITLLKKHDIGNPQ